MPGKGSLSMAQSDPPWSAAAGRFAACLLLWLVLTGPGLADLAVGVFAAGCAAWVSLRLIPASGARLSWPSLAGLLLRLPWQSLVAGVDVARRALDPRLPLRTGLVAAPCGLAPGMGRDAFRALMSLQPGTLPVSAGEGGELMIHCLDTSQPVVAQMAAEEARFRRVIGS